MNHQQETFEKKEETAQKQTQESVSHKGIDTTKQNILLINVKHVAEIKSKKMAIKYS